MAGEDAKKTGQCLVCKRTFSFDPKQVETVLIDPETGFPPGFTILGSMRPAKPESVARSVDQPICPGCLERVERLWKQHNAPPPDWESWPPTQDPL